MKRLVLLVLFVLCACTGADTAAPPRDDPPTDTAAPPRDDPPTDAAAVPKGLDWTADLIGDGMLEGATLAGGDVALWFWAPW